MYLSFVFSATVFPKYKFGDKEGDKPDPSPTPSISVNLISNLLVISLLFREYYCSFINYKNT